MLAPLSVILIYLSVPFSIESFISGENSPNAGGLVVWPSKFLILAGFVLLFAQMVSEVIKRMAVLLGEIAEPEAQPIHGHEPADTAVGGGHGQ